MKHSKLLLLLFVVAVCLSFSHASASEAEIEAQEDDLLSIFDEEAAAPAYKLLGCYKDGWQRVFSHESQLNPNSVSPATCGAWAASKGYKYFGMQVGRECRGGDKYDTLGKANNCNVPVRRPSACPSCSFPFFSTLFLNFRARW